MYSRLLCRARLRQLQLLVMVADQGSLKRASCEVGMSQAAATQALAELEHLIEQPLFDRHAKGMRLTAAGCTLMPIVRNVLDALRNSTDSLAALHEGASGVLRVGAIAAVSPTLSSDSVLRLCARHPALRIEIIEDTQPHLVQELISGGLDLVLCRPVQPLPCKLHFEPLQPDEAWVIAGPLHPMAARPGLQLSDLAGYAWMRAARGVWVRAIFDQAFEHARLRPRLHPLSLGSLGPLPAILSDNQTITMVPLGIARSLCRAKLAVRLDVEFTAPRGEIGLLCSNDALDEPLHVEFKAAFLAS